MKAISFLVLLILVVFNQFYSSVSSVGAEGINCDNRYLTLVNPVRGRSLWNDKSLNPIKDQYNLINTDNLPATWLLQYDVLSDEELLKTIKGFDAKQELGVFLEVSPKFADEARVIYPLGMPWFYPNVVLLSAYSQTERRKLIDKLFTEFKNSFGFYPKSVGAWWIDSYSLNYMKEKYGIKAAMIVADQLTTDRYGVWGQWWGVPYYPSKANILTPAASLEQKQNVVMVQWAQRDPLQAYGESPKYSNYSLQANDYIRQGKDTKYFQNLTNIYLDCQNKLGQITVGLETGIESVGYINEYKNQLDYLKQQKNIRPVTMSQFADYFALVYPDFPKEETLSYQNSVWSLTIKRRTNSLLGDATYYQPQIAFSDYFLPDKNSFLDRRLISENKQKDIPYYPYFILAAILLGVVSTAGSKTKLFLISFLTALLSFGLIFRSFYQYGWAVYYGPVVSYLPLVQIGLIIAPFVLLSLIQKICSGRIPLYFWLWPLTYGFDLLLQSIRLTILSGSYYLGLLVDPLHFVGVVFSKGIQLRFINQDLPAYQAAALLKIGMEKIWENLWVYLLIYPVVHLLLAIVIAWLLFRLPRIKKLIIIMLSLLAFGYLISLWQADPRTVLPLR